MYIKRKEKNSLAPFSDEIVLKLESIGMIFSKEVNKKNKLGRDVQSSKNIL